MPDTVTLPTIDDAVALGLTREEYELIVDKLERPPNQVELAMFSLLWSEHCAYKHSKLLLRTLPTEGAHVVMGPGENAGAVSVGDGLAVAFKVESHNHPSAVEPFQGAATGVGGILRDIFALGARPIAVLDSLRFGEPGDSERSRYLLDHAVAGIGHYGNSIGVPTVGGEVYFEAPYEQNCLVNAMALGLAETRHMVRSAAAGVGNVVVLFGASTGRDGIGGASVLASAELDEADGDKRPSVQVGDPFAEKKLMECSLELLERGLLVSLQDLGAAGLTSSASEMASKGGVGIDLDVARVPLREAGMEPFEIMVSESQERMLCVCTPERVDDVLAVCERWEVHGTASRRGHRHRRACASSAATSWLPTCPWRRSSTTAPSTRSRPSARARRCTPRRARRWRAMRRCATSCRLCWPRPTWPRAGRCSSSTTGSCSRARCAAPRRPTPRCSRCPTAARSASRSTATGAASPPTPIRARSARSSNARPTWPASAPSRSASPTTSTSATPRSRTSPGSSARPCAASATRAAPSACRSPAATSRSTTRAPPGRSTRRPSSAWSAACPTRPARRGWASRARATRSPSRAGTRARRWPRASSAKLWGEPLPDGLPDVDLARACEVLEVVRDAVRGGDLSSCHDIAEGGLLVAVAESCLAGGVGATLDLGPSDEVWCHLFGERPAGFVVSGPREALEALGRSVPLDVFGTVGGDALQVAIGAESARWALPELKEAHEALARFFP